MRDRARVVVIGGGVGGCAILYWLTKLGWDDVLLVERADLTSGSTFHSAGLVGQLRGSLSLTKMMMSSVELYRTLGDEVGLETGWHEVGSLRLASSEERMEEIARQAGWAKTFGLPLELVSADEAQRLFPPMSTDGVLGAAYLPTDGYIDPSQLTFALAEGARRGGAEIATNTRVTGIELERNRVRGVETDQGRVETETVVDAGGMFAAELGALAGVIVPVVPMAHEYLITRPAGLPLDLPTMRDPSLLVYFRGESGGLVMGGYERNPAPWGLDGIPRDFNGQLLEEDWERFEELMQNAVVRVPALADAEVVRLVNGPEAFTPDGEFILGPTDVHGFWVAAGFCAHGLAGAGGMGKLVAEWIVEELPSLDVWEMDSRRFGAHYASREYTLARTLEVYSTYYDVKYPGHERQAGRPLRLSPAYARLKELGASFGEKSGWERANWFEPNAADGDESLRPGGWAGRHWSPAIEAEHRAVRETAALFDETSFAKIEVAGRGAADFLERLCDNRVAREVGADHLHADAEPPRRDRVRLHGHPARRRPLPDRHRHGVRAPRPRLDLVTRARRRLRHGRRRHVAVRLPRDLGPERARDPAAAHDRRPRERRLPVHARASAGDRAGPLPRPPRDLRRRARLGALLPGRVRPRALGRDLGQRPGHGLVAGGYKAIDSCRLEKGYRVWGADITPDDTPYEAGLGFAVKLDKGDFIGSRRAPRQAGAGTEARVPRARRTARGRARLGAGARRQPPGRPGHERRLRLHGGPVDRLRLPPRRLRDARDCGRGRDLRILDRGRGRRGALVRPGRIAHPFLAAVAD